MRRVTAEAVGSFLLVFAAGGALFVGEPAGSATLVALAAGMALAAATLVLGPISGACLNPAVAVAAAIAGRLRAREMAAYVAAQLAGATAAAALLAVLARGRAGATQEAPALLANGWGALSPGWYGMEVALVVELGLGAVLVLAWLGVSQASWWRRALLLGALQVALYLVAVPVTGAALNPARALATAWFVGGVALEQVWLFVAAPLAGAIVAALLHRAVRGRGVPRLARAGGAVATSCAALLQPVRFPTR
ncbi:MAG: aquaporin [Polyangiaceae bacterium]